MTVGLVAGEASGDLLGAHLVEALKARRPDLQFEGIAGPRMIAAGVKALYPCEKLSVGGYVEVLRHLPEIARIRRGITRHFLRTRPQVFIGIDAPDFNLGVEFKFRAAGISTIHYVSPSIWAWRGERIHFIKQAVDHVLALFPFEPPLYEKAGIPVSYVGHPLADLLADYPDQAAVRASLGLAAEVPVIALLPGSRVIELKAMADLMVATAKRIAAAVPGARFVAPLINPPTRALFEAALQREPGVNIQLLEGRSHDAMAAADVVLLASGTATLETALLKRPMVITYRMPRISAWMIKRRGYLKFVGLPNILANEAVVPELLQEAATPQALAQAVIDLLNDAPRRQRISERFARMLADLKQNNAQKAADAVMPYLERKRT
ncbi:MAG: lipid-A-disaccharide synthase [Betaproteobacteria bacterium]|nr:lipid-A-disaccharide synthase [Betaproteobacteria bacterium]